jgi:F-type H+-transporting ATPase subunit b
MSFLRQFAAETAGQSDDIFVALGIDWRLLILQIIAFLILVVLLGKFVYPWLMKSVDQRRTDIEAASKAAAKAQEAVAKNKEEIAELLHRARKEAAEIVDTAKLESAEMVTASEKKARMNAEQIVADAHTQIDKDVANVKKELYNETLELVAMATGKVVGSTLSVKTDRELIAAAVEESK